MICINIKYLPQIIFSDFSHPWKMGWVKLRKRTINIKMMAAPREWAEEHGEHTKKGVHFCMAGPLAQEPRWSHLMDRGCAKALMLLDAEEEGLCFCRQWKRLLKKYF